MTHKLRRTWLALALAVLLLALSPLLAACDGKSSEAARATTITVVDYNIFHGLYDEDPNAPSYDRFQDRLELLSQQLAKLHPDVIVLQEVVLEGPKDYPDVKAILQDALGDEYKMIFAEVVPSRFASETTRINQGTFGRMTLTRLPVVVPLAESKFLFNGRSAHRVSVRSKAGIVDVFNVHLEGSEFLGQQELETTRLLTFIDGLGRNQNPVIVTGDFNTRPGDAAITAMFKAGFEDVLVAAGADVTCDKLGDPGCTRATIPSVSFPQRRQDIRIDYMFARGSSELGLRVIGARPFMDEPLKSPAGGVLWTSDHIGIVATLEISPNGKR